MEITTEMLHAAMTEAVKQKVLPKYGDTQTYEEAWAKMELILQAALNASGE